MKLSKIETKPSKSVSEKEIRGLLPERVQLLATIQNKLYAQGKYGVLVIFQGLDASGKDGAVKHVFSGVNPAGCRVKSFKVPTEEESKHDFLWRIHKECPERGMIQIFNRSQYEDILVPMVHGSMDKKEMMERMQAINSFEKLLVDSGIILLKFYLHVSNEEQEERILERKTNPEKRWKYQKSDVIDSKLREDFMDVYEQIFENCTVVPWNIIPSDKNWYKNFQIIECILAELARYKIDYPVRIVE